MAARVCGVTLSLVDSARKGGGSGECCGGSDGGGDGGSSSSDCHVSKIGVTRIERSATITVSATTGVECNAPKRHRLDVFDNFGWAREGKSRSCVSCLPLDLSYDRDE